MRPTQAQARVVTDGLSPMQLGRLNAALDKQVRIDGVVMTWRAYALTTVSKRESDGMASYSRTRFNRMDGREQEAYMARLKAKRVFILQDAEGYGREVPKIIFDAVTYEEAGEAEAAANWTEEDSAALFGEARPTFTVTGGEGELTVCTTTGDILDRTPDAYPDFIRIDVAEWLAFYAGEELAGQSVDICDTAGWTTMGAYSAAEPDFRVELAFTHGGGAFIPAERFRSVEVCGWVEADGVIKAIPGQPASAAHGFGVYGREAEGEPLAVHLFDMKAHASALSLAREYAGALPVRNLVGEA